MNSTGAGSAGPDAARYPAGGARQGKPQRSPASQVPALPKGDRKKSLLVEFVRVEYDAEATLRKIRSIPELDDFLGERLLEGR